MWSIYGHIGEKYIVWDGMGCEIHCSNIWKADFLVLRLNNEKICGNTILPEWVKEYQ